MNISKIWANRGSQIGDCVASLTLSAFFREHYGDAYIYFQVAKKHAHAMPLFYNNPLIDNLFISDCEEGYGPRDIEIAKSCYIHTPLMPEHTRHDWPNHFDFYQETFLMSGLTMEHWNSVDPESLRPKLTQWFNVTRRRKTVAYFPCAAYGQTQVRRSRNCTRPWAVSLVNRLMSEGYSVIQLGHPNDFADCGGSLGATQDLRHLTFMENIQIALGCDVVIGTDSGAAIAIAGYGHPQITLLTDHFPNHVRNLPAFQPWNPNNRSFIGIGSADVISIDEVVETVKNVTA